MSQILIKVIGNYQYQTAHCLGEGVYGKVYQGIERETKQKVAIKKIDLISLANDKYLQNAIFSQIYLLKRFDHPNIVKFKDVLSSKNSLYIITEFCKGGDLRDQIRKRRFSQDQVFQVLIQIVNGFKELVAKRVVHRDLKPANILIHDGVYKICDFGFAKYVDNFGNQMLKSCVGSPIYMAPQLLERQSYTTKCDIWSLGVITYEMLHGLSPWRAKDENELLHGLKTISINTILKSSKFISSKMSDFIAKCLVYNEKQRYNWNEIFSIFLPPQLPQQPSLTNQYSSSSASTPVKSSVKIYNPKLRTTEPLELDFHSQINHPPSVNKNSSLYEREKEENKLVRVEGRSKSPNVNFMQYRQEKLDKPSFTQAYTPRQHNNSLNHLHPTSTPRQNNSNFYISLNTLQIPSSPVATTPSTIISPRPQPSTQSPRKSYMQNQLKKQLTVSDYKKQEKLYNQCQYRYFCCTELFIVFQELNLSPSGSYSYTKMLYLLTQFIKKQNSYIRSELLVAPYNQTTQQLLIKIEIQQKLTETLEKDIITLMEMYNYYERVQNQVKNKMSFFLSELMNEEKLDRISDVFYEVLAENAVFFMNLKEENKYSWGDESDQLRVVVDILWYLSDLMIMYKNVSNSLGEVSQRSDEDRNDVVLIDKRIEKILN